MDFAHWFSFRRPQPRRRKPAPRRFDSLEKRYVLSSAPLIDALSAVVGAGHTVSISGHVTDLDPHAGAISVALSGPVSATVSADATGAFSYSGPASLLGSEQAVAADAGTGLSSAAVLTSIQNAAPLIQSFSVAPTGSGQNVSITGHVQDESAAGLAVSFAGVASGSATTDAAGNFSLIALASGLGNVTASTSDVWGVASAPATATLSDPGPTVQLNAPQVANGMVTISGTVSDLTPGGETIALSGVVSGSAVTNSSGAFSLTAPYMGAGTVTATATNVWKQTSAPAQTNVAATPAPAPTSAPTITIMGLLATYSGSGRWLISGTAQGGDYSTMTISFTGTNSGTTIPDNYGNFSFTVNASGNPLYSGTATVTATDAAGDTSNSQTVTFSQ